MNTRSLSLHSKYIQKANNALTSLGLTKKEFAETRLQLSRSTVSNCLNGKPVSKENFVKIFGVLKLDWKEMAGLKINTEDIVHNLDSSKKSNDIEELVNRLREQVLPRIKSRCGTMKILDMSQPMDLDDIYTEVNILEKITGRSRKSINELNDNLENFERFNIGRTKETITDKEAIDKYRTLLILGKPGSGKTTFLKQTINQCSRNLFSENLIPFFITLKEFAEVKEQPTLLDYINRYVDSHDKDALTCAMKSGKALICLDGLDEVLIENSQRVNKEIENLVNDYPGNQYLMTCRIAAKEYNFTQFTEVEIADFSWSQITVFAKKWFQNKAFTPNTFLNRLKKDKPIQRLASSPLLLTLLCLAFEESGDFPGNRAGLYKEGIDALLKKWDAKRGIKRDEVYQKLWIQRKEDLLSKMAWKFFYEGELFFEQSKAEREIGKYIRNLSGINSDKEELRLDSEAVLKSIESQHGLLVERAKNIYSFSHLTFQEYFTAREIIVVDQSSNEALQELVSHIFDKRWREIFLLSVAMSSNADKLLLLMKNKIDCLFANSDKLCSFLISLEKKATSFNVSNIDNLGLFSSVVRSFYFATESKLSCILALTINQDFSNAIVDSQQRQLDRNISMFLKYTNKLYTENAEYYNEYETLMSDFEFKCLLKDIEEAFRKVLFHTKDNDFSLRSELFELAKEAPGRKATRGFGYYLGDDYIWKADSKWWIQEGKEWIERIREVIVKYRHIGNEWNFSSKEIELLKTYYYSNQLLIECLHQDCYVSLQVRQIIEENLLLPITEIQKRNNILY